jgi:uncharacterized protein YyaL (SSP411 family)
VKNQYVSRVSSNKNAVTIGALVGLLSSLLLAGTSCKPADPVDQPAPGGKSAAKPAATVPDKPVKHAHTNRLAKEKSPYLLQHQHNPVDWYPWGEEAFKKARAENKPIFLSIGYSTCHWCHVMERESFEDEKVAKYLNDNFVSIKVDREERPDVDKIYMTAVQAMTRRGGWPLTAFLTPDRKPFFGGTYFPPESRGGLPSFTDLLQRINQLWTTRRSDIDESAEQLHKQISELSAQTQSTDTVLAPAVLTNALALFKVEYDPTHGGFGRAPKFPRPTQPAFILRQGVRHKDEEAIRMVLHTCERMAAGGMNDQLGGGFARYSVDAEWLVPHFEKMLYDNAQLLHLYLDAYLVGGDARHAVVARDIIRYLLRDMTHKDGGFYSAEDADSEGQEGKFYCWTQKELTALLTPDELKVAVRYFGITEKGNFEDHSHPDPLPNLNVLSIVDPKLAPAEETLLASAKQKMFAVRVKRVRPHLDDKILASWNGLMLGALARASVVLGDDTYRVAAEKNLAFLQATLWDAKTKTLYHRWRDGQRDSTQLLDDYAFLLSGVIELYETTLESKHLDFALALADSMGARFYDAEQGGFFLSADKTADLILRVKEDYDGAEPSGNSVAALALLKLTKITERPAYAKQAEKTLRLFGQRLQAQPQAVPYLLGALDYFLHEPFRAVIIGEPAQADTRALIRAAHSVYQPNKVVLGNSGPVEPAAKTYPLFGGKPAVYLCTGQECQLPTGDPEKLKQMLK